MLELKPNCEGCDADLPASAPDAMICSFECTFCRECVNGRLDNVCPNCGGGFTLRPVRPKAMLDASPASTERAKVGVDAAQHVELSVKYAGIPPHQR